MKENIAIKLSETSYKELGKVFKVLYAEETHMKYSDTHLSYICKDGYVIRSTYSERITEEEYNKAKQDELINNLVEGEVYYIKSENHYSYLCRYKSIANGSLCGFSLINYFTSNKVNLNEGPILSKAEISEIKLATFKEKLEYIQQELNKSLIWNSKNNSYESTNDNL